MAHVEAEHELPDAGSHGGLEQLVAVGDVVVEILPRVGHRFPNQRIGGEMDNGIRMRLLDGVPEVIRLLGPARDEPRPRVHRRAVPLAQIIIDRNLPPRIEQLFGANRTDITRAACDEHIHRKPTRANSPQLPTRAVVALDEWGGGRAIHGLEPDGVPGELRARAEGDVAKVVGNRERAGVEEVARGRFARLAGVKPLLMMAARFRNERLRRFEILEFLLRQQQVLAIVGKQHSRARP